MSVLWSSSAKLTKIIEEKKTNKQKMGKSDQWLWGLRCNKRSIRMDNFQLGSVVQSSLSVFFISYFIYHSFHCLY